MEFYKVYIKNLGGFEETKVFNDYMVAKRIFEEEKEDILNYRVVFYSCEFIDGELKDIDIILKFSKDAENVSIEKYKYNKQIK